jgi:hypothetical protein
VKLGAALVVSLLATLTAPPVFAGTSKPAQCPRVDPSISITLAQAAVAAKPLLARAHTVAYDVRSKPGRIDIRAVVRLAAGSSTLGGVAPWRSRVVAACGRSVADAAWLVQFYAQSTIAFREPGSAIVIRGVRHWVLWYSG